MTHDLLATETRVDRVRREAHAALDEGKSPQDVIDSIDHAKREQLGRLSPVEGRRLKRRLEHLEDVAYVMEEILEERELEEGEDG